MTRPQLGQFGWSCIHGEDCLEGAKSWRRKMSDGCDYREDAAAAVGSHHPLRQIGEGEIPWLLPSSHALVFHNFPLAEPTWRPTDKRGRQCSTLVGRTEQEKDREGPEPQTCKRLHVCMQRDEVVLNTIK